MVLPSSILTPMRVFSFPWVRPVIQSMRFELTGYTEREQAREIAWLLQQSNGALTDDLERKLSRIAKQRFF